MTIKGVIFDMDGLMIDTEKLLKQFWCEAANEFGYSMTAEHVLSIRSLAAKYAIPKLKGYFGEDFDYAAVRARRIELMNQYIDVHGVEKKKGLDSLLTYLKNANIKMAVATATDEIRTKKYLESIGIYHLFDEVICATMVENGKPAPDIYLKAADALHLSPESCMALEDSPNGILSAFRAGCIPVMVPDLDEPEKATLEILYKKVEDLEKVILLLEKLNQGDERDLFEFRRKFICHTEFSIAKKPEMATGVFEPEFYISEIEEPDFGCEGRPEGIPICAKMKIRHKYGRKIVPMEEKKIWALGWDNGMWFGTGQNKEGVTVPCSYKEKDRQLKFLDGGEKRTYFELKEMFSKQPEGIKYILFDFDGTLTESKEGIVKSFQYALAYMGMTEKNPETLEKVIGPPLKDSFMQFYHMSKEEAEQAVLKYRERYETVGLYENKVFDGIEDMLKRLTEEGFLLAIASSKPTVFIEKICAYFHIQQYFHHMVGSLLDGTRVKKEEVIEEAISQFGGEDFREVIMVGDRKFDILGAHQIGIKAVGVTFGYGKPEELKAAKADYIVDTVKELETLLLNLKNHGKF